MRFTSVVIMIFPSLVFAAKAPLFSVTYEEARLRFLSDVSAVESKTKQDFFRVEFPDPEDKSLITDVAWLRAKSNLKNLVVITSGLHGIEGYAGSAVQSHLLRKLNAETNFTNDYLFVHALNPYGFKNYLRGNRNNIDLNRNLVVRNADFQRENKSYADINNFLNPTTKARVHDYSQYTFIFDALKMILRFSIESLRQSILTGQYQFEKGIYYGGTIHQYQRQIIDQLYDTVFKNYNYVFVIDLHTGYGQKNKLHVLANSKDQPTALELKKVFADAVDFGDKEKFYSVQGDLISYLEAKASPANGQQIAGVVFEFGTLDSQKTLGSIESLRRMVLENQQRHFGSDEATSKIVKNQFLEMFYPSASEWRETILVQTDMQMEKVTDYLKGR